MPRFTKSNSHGKFSPTAHWTPAEEDESVSSINYNVGYRRDREDGDDDDQKPPAKRQKTEPPSMPSTPSHAPGQERLAI